MTQADTTTRWFQELADLNLFAVLDAARSPSVLETLEALKPQFASLYSEKDEAPLKTVAPYLVEPEEGTPMGILLLEPGWGRPWSIYIATKADFQSLRRHLRRFLIVEDEQGTKQYFRFYDPRILREYLPTCTPEEVKDFFGPISTIFCPTDDVQKLIAYNMSEDGLEKRIIEDVASPPPEGDST